MTNEELELYADQYCIDKFGAKTGNKAVRDALIDGYNLALRKLWEQFPRPHGLIECECGTVYDVDVERRCPNCGN